MHGKLVAVSFLLILLLGCTVQDRMIFGDGVAALTGRGGEVARGDAMPSTRSLIHELAPQQPQPGWVSQLPEEAVDFATYIDQSRLLIGTVESGAYLGIPDFKDIILYDTTKGIELWHSPRHEIRNGRYSVLTTVPNIVLAGWGEQRLWLLGYQPDNGTKIWQHEIDAPFRAVTDRETLLVTGFENNTWSLTAFNIKDGTVRWRHTVASRVSADQPVNIVVDKGSLLLVSREVTALSLADGKTKWHASIGDDKFTTLDLSRQADSYLLVGMEGLVRINATNGAASWLYHAKVQPIRMAAVSAGRVFLLRGDGPLLKSAAGNETGFSIDCVDLRSGKLIWRYALPSRATSALLHLSRRLVLSTKNQLIVLDAAQGKSLFQRTFSDEMIAASPTEARYQGQPDLLEPRGDNIIVARELYGVAAFSLQSGKRIWEQPHYLQPQNNPYTVNWQAGVLEKTMKLYGFNPAKAAPVEFGFQQTRNESLILQTLQHSTDSAIAQANRTLADRSTTRLGGRLAHTSKITSIESNIIAERMQQNQAAIQATFDFMWAYMDLVEALGEALKQRAYQALFERLAMKMNSTLAARAHAFQGDYYVWPFQERGRGLTLIDLNTGRRNDLIFSPAVPPLTDYGVDLTVYAIDPSGKHLVTFGVPLDEQHLQEYVKWKWRVPHEAALDYNLAKLTFTRKSTTAKYWEENLKTDLVEWANVGNLAKVKELIAHGVNVNQEKYTVTPLWMAIYRGHADIVRVLIAHGANVNWEHTMMKVKPLMMAKNVKASSEIIKMLEDAGATE